MPGNRARFAGKEFPAPSWVVLSSPCKFFNLGNATRSYLPVHRFLLLLRREYRDGFRVEGTDEVVAPPSELGHLLRGGKVLQNEEPFGFVGRSLLLAQKRGQSSRSAPPGWVGGQAVGVGDSPRPISRAQPSATLSSPRQVRPHRLRFEVVAWVNLSKSAQRWREQRGSSEGRSPPSFDEGAATGRGRVFAFGFLPLRARDRGDRRREEGGASRGGPESTSR